MFEPFSKVRSGRVFVGCFAGVLALVWSAKCVAGGAQSFTFQLSNVTQTVKVLNPCLGPMIGVLNYDGVVHVTQDGDALHEIVQIHGTSLVFPVDPNEPSFAGAFAEVQTLQLDHGNTVSTFTVTQVGPSMKFHITFQLVLDLPRGASVTVFNVACGP
jgi:hypothetical protein